MCVPALTRGSISTISGHPNYMVRQTTSRYLTALVTCSLLCISCFAFVPAGVMAADALSGEQDNKPHGIEAKLALQVLEQLVFPSDVAVNFTQRQLNPLIKNISEQRGVMTKSSTAGLVMQVTHPRFEERTLHNGIVTLTRKKARSHNSRPGNLVRRLQLNPDRPSHLVLLALRALLYGHFGELQTHFNLTLVEPSTDTWQIVLQPVDRAVRNQLSELHLFGQANRLTRFRSQRTDAAGHTSHWLEVHIGPPA